MPEHDDFADLPSLARFGDAVLAAAERPQTARLSVRDPAGAWLRAVAMLRRPMTGRGLAIGLATLVVTGSAMAATLRFVVEPSKPAYDVARYLGRGDAFDCTQFASQALAQAVLRADPRDPNFLDADRDGIACPQLPAPKDLEAVASIAAGFRCRPNDPRSARCPQPWRRFSAADYTGFGADAYDCKQLASQADAQAVLRYAPTDPNHLDGDGDGIACPDLPAPRDLTPVVRRPPS